MRDKEEVSMEFMTVGEVAKKMGVTVRTLQYYDKQGVFSPSAESRGGRRLYTYKDMVRLHQILSLKSLGFSLDDIKNRLISLDSPDDVADALSRQAAAVREKIDRLTESLSAIEMLKSEVMQIQTVDFKKYADIIVNFHMNNEYYWLIKHFDDSLLDNIRSRFDEESGTIFMEKYNCLSEEAIGLSEKGVPPEDEKAQVLAEKFWTLITEFTGGDISMLQELIEFGKFEGIDNDWVKKQAEVNAYLDPALEIYFSRMGMNPFGEGEL